LKRYFSQFGEVFHCLLMRDTITGKSRGFGYVTMKDSLIIEKILNKERHFIEGKEVECKIAIPKDYINHKTINNNMYSLNKEEKSDESSMNLNTNKIFAGGLPASLTEGKKL
jgi:RNA-binding protein Musashi